ncbi:MAG: RIP metalloprotease RseP [Nitrospirota bacterium]
MTFFYAIVLLGILIFVHELGHFLFAKLLGVKVLKFSLGFGPKIVGKTLGETEYRISALPLGGYVKMLGEEPGEELQESDKPRAYNHQPVWKRFLIVFSGPVFNIFFASFILSLIFLSGIPLPYADVGTVAENSPAARAGLMTGDRVLEIDGKAMESWNDVVISVIDSSGRELLFKVRRGKEIIALPVNPEKKVQKTVFGEDKETFDIGVLPLFPPVVGEVMQGTPAEKAGMKKGDEIVGIDGSVIRTWHDMTEIVHESPEKPLKFKIKRDEGLMEMTIIPERKTIQTPADGGKEIGLIGITPRENDFIKAYGPVDAVLLGVRKTWDISALTVISIVKLVQRIIPAETIGGPILIFQMAGQQASQGAPNFFTFMAIISINLGILNLLPIPILDGGHIMFLGIEAVRRKPLSENAIIIAQKIGLVLLLSLMAFAFYNDIIRLFTGKMLP